MQFVKLHCGVVGGLVDADHSCVDGIDPFAVRWSARDIEDAAWVEEEQQSTQRKFSDA
jgi:hypothetical protein